MALDEILNRIKAFLHSMLNEKKKSSTRQVKSVRYNGRNYACRTIRRVNPNGECRSALNFAIIAPKHLPTFHFGAAQPGSSIPEHDRLAAAAQQTMRELFIVMRCRFQ